MRRALAILEKELCVLRRDLHGLLVLFVMPVAFILVMSLAMQGEYASRTDAPIDVWIVDADDTARSRRAVGALAEQAGYRLLTPPDRSDLTTVRELLMDDRAQLAIHIPRGYFERFDTVGAPPEASAPRRPALLVLAAPSVRRPMALLLVGAAKEAVARVRLDQLLADLGDPAGEPKNAVDATDSAGEAFLSDTLGPDATPVPEDAIELRHLRRGELLLRAPSAVQQSVPAWLVFSMFFVVIPLSNTFIAERQLGTFQRLRSMDVAPALLLLGKLVPYALVNQLQVALMLAVGVYLVPLLGGETLALGRSPLGLAVMAAGVSLGALGFALLVAALARTTEQATIAGGAGSILLGAVGGIMVPRFLMPATMQSLSWVSPMAWGLEGFLDVLLREGGVVDVLPEAGALAAFGLVALLLASWRLRAESA